MLILLVSSFAISARPPRTDDAPFAITPRIHINTPEIKNALTLWGKYISSRVNNTPHEQSWINCTNKEITEDVLDPWLPNFGFMNNEIKVLILSAERSTDVITIRSLWFRNDVQTSLPDPLAITQTNVLMNDTNAIGLCNPIEYSTSSWKKRAVGGITYIVPPDFKLNYRAAERMVDFCDSLTALYDVGDVEDCSFIIASSPDELAQLCGIEYFVAPPKGLAYPSSKIMLSALHNEWYPHEIAHIIFRQFLKTHHFLYEGIAVFVGGSVYDSYKELIKKTYKELHTQQKPTFSEILQNPVKHSMLYYALGGILMNVVYENGGASAVKRLLSSSTNTTPYSELTQKIEQSLSIKPETFEKGWYEIFEKYAQRYED